MRTDTDSEKPHRYNSTHYLPPLAPVSHPSKVTALVGRRCLVECFLNGHKLQALCDTGSQVSIIDERWKDEYLPSAVLTDVSEKSYNIDFK